MQIGQFALRPFCCVSERHLCECVNCQPCQEMLSGCVACCAGDCCVGCAVLLLVMMMLLRDAGGPPPRSAVSPISPSHPLHPPRLCQQCGQAAPGVRGRLHCELCLQCHRPPHRPSPPFSLPLGTSGWEACRTTLTQLTFMLVVSHTLSLSQCSA